MNKKSGISLLFSLLACTSASASDAVGMEWLPIFKKCAEIEDDAERLACWDDLATRDPSELAHLAPTPAAPADSPPAPPAITVEEGPTPITDEIGRERVEGGREEERPEYSATVIRCEENQQSGQTFFFFENGQVWKQANYRRLRFRECRFEITLSEDNFGYSLYIPSEDRRVRVTRIR